MSVIIIDPYRHVVATPSTTVYVEEDFTATTSGDLTDNNLAVDELGLGFGTDAADYNYAADGSGVEAGATAVAKDTVVQTDGREDVQIVSTMLLSRGGSSSRWPGICLRCTSTTVTSGTGMTLYFDGATTGPNLVLRNGLAGGSLLKTWDLGSLLTTPPVEFDRVTIVVRCAGNDIALYSVQVNGGTVEVVNDVGTLSGGAATDHGAGSGADFYGIGWHRPGAEARHEYFKVESIPA